MPKDLYAKRAAITGKVTLPPLSDEEKSRRVTFKVREHENGEQSVLEIRGCGYGRHELDVRLDTPRDGHFDEQIRCEWDGDSHEIELGFIPVAAIAVLDGIDEIRF